MTRIAVIGNSGGGKSTLARALARKTRAPYHEIDALLWRPGWILQPDDIYEAEHHRLLALDHWVIDGLGRLESVPDRLARASEIILIDMPLWMHFSLAARRQLEWAQGTLAHPPAGHADMPDMEALFETIWTVDRDWMPKIRDRIAMEERAHKPVRRIASIDELTRYSSVV